MIAILTDKPNVGKEIARILGAHTREDGYMSGNGYMVTWTFGNMLSLAMPKDYGMDRPERGDFPINPAPFRLMVKHIKTDTGWIPDINAVLQLKVIEKVFDACESIIAATDASREGEMVFRYLYRYLECRKSYRRLWISSLTDEAVLEGMDNLRPGSLYDHMFLAADSRNKADWVLGLNASYALCQATGTGNNSLGRVQTPILAAISSRYRERENHIATDTFPVFISLCKNNTLLKMRCTEEFTDREAAARLYSDCKLAGHARVTAVSRQVREIEPPALYNLTELQKDANNYYGMTAGKSLEIAQKLYEKKLISYPRTAGLGTAATRTGILQTLIDRKYVRYSGKYIIPTRKGLYIYETVRNMKIAETALTSGWEAQLARMERGKLTQEEFMKGVLKLSREVTEDIFRKCER